MLGDLMAQEIDGISLLKKLYKEFSQEKMHFSLLMNPRN